MTESAFSKLFYEQLLRLNFSMYTGSIYKCFENCLFVINIHLKTIELSQFGRIKVLPSKRMIGFEAIISILVYAQDESVHSASRKLLFDMLLAELETGKHIDKLAFEDVILPCREIIKKEYSELACNLNSIEILKKAICLLKDVVQFLNGESSSEKESKADKKPLGPVFLREGFSSIKLIIENNVRFNNSRLW